MGQARTALDQMAEVAILNGRTAELIQTKTFGADFSSAMMDFQQRKVELAKDWNALKAMFDENTAKVVDAISRVAGEDLPTQIEMPWGPMALEQIISYPYWNMSYHEGQINYIASMLGCLS